MLIFSVDLLLYLHFPSLCCGGLSLSFLPLCPLPWLCLLCSECRAVGCGCCGLGAHRVNRVGHLQEPFPVLTSQPCPGFPDSVAQPCCTVACGFRELHIHIGCNLCPRDLPGCWRSLHSVPWRVLADSCFSLVVALTADSHRQRTPTD